MFAYPGDIMEDDTDFVWVTTKASDAVRFCVMERGSLSWFGTEHINSIRRAHAQRHSTTVKQNWGKGSESNSRACYCRKFQMGLCSH